MECESGAIPLLANFEIVEQSTDIGKKQVVDLGLLWRGGSILAKGFFKVPELVGKGRLLGSKLAASPFEKIGEEAAESLPEGPAS